MHKFLWRYFLCWMYWTSTSISIHRLKKLTFYRNQTPNRERKTFGVDRSSLDHPKEESLYGMTRSQCGEICPIVGRLRRINWENHELARRWRKRRFQKATQSIIRLRKARKKVQRGILRWESNLLLCANVVAGGRSEWISYVEQARLQGYLPVPFFLIEVCLC